MLPKKSLSPGRIGPLIAAWAHTYRSHGSTSHYHAAAEILNQAAGQLAPHQLNNIIASAALAQIKAEVGSYHTYFVRAGCLRRLCRFLTQNGAPQISLPRLRRPQARAVTATPGEVQRLLAHAGPGMRLFILLCWQTGLRYSEALRVTPGSLDERTGVITVRTKGDRMRRIPATPEIATALQIAGESGDRNTSAVAILHGHTITSAGIRTAWWRLTKNLGLTHIKPHDLRRTVLTALYAVTKDLRAVQQYAGHDALTSTIHYLAPLNEEKLREYQQLLNFHDYTSETKN